MDLKEKLAALEEMFEMDENSLSVDMRLDDIEEWDSMSKLYLMTYVKKHMKKQLTIQEINGFVTVNDICDYLV